MVALQQLLVVVLWLAVETVPSSVVAPTVLTFTATPPAPPAAALRRPAVAFRRPAVALRRPAVALRRPALGLSLSRAVDRGFP
jgi:hypothetical protein